MARVVAAAQTLAAEIQAVNAIYAEQALTIAEARALGHHSGCRARR